MSQNQETEHKINSTKLPKKSIKNKNA